MHARTPVAGQLRADTHWLCPASSARGASTCCATATPYQPNIRGQAASGGFLGGSVTWDLRTSPDPFFAPMVGWGRTNTKTYYNLNFDPNDSYLVGGSFSLPSKALLSVYLVADDRLGTGQKVTHAVFRRPIGKDMRLTVDLFSRQGRSEAGAPRVSGNGLSVGWDYRDFFLKFTHDARANFTPANMNRLVTGFRF
jgi:hypothetical protein